MTRSLVVAVVVGAFVTGMAGCAGPSDQAEATYLTIQRPRYDVIDYVNMTEDDLDRYPLFQRVYDQLQAQGNETTSATIFLGGEEIAAATQMVKELQSRHPDDPWSDSPGDVVARFRGSFYAIGVGRAM